MRPFTPIGNTVLVKQDPAIEPSLILVTKPEFPPFGTILALGPKVDNPDLAVGTRVLIKRTPASALVPDEREGDYDGWYGLLVLDAEDGILGVVEE